jgi:hypothetical protein
MRKTMYAMRWAGLSGLVLLLAGCGGSGLGDPVEVQGRVTFRGDPVADAKVTFHATVEDGRSASGKTDGSGNFRLTTFRKDDGAVPGDYAISISKFEPGGGGGGAMSGEDPSAAADYGAMMEAAARGETAKLGKELLPEKYANPAESGLTRSVVKGQRNEFEFELD